ncbi:YfiT family bacillithiol transferase [Muriicola sp.]|uniref:YfiT family bacillithiol transferase n=1 Tax=Muriicola sp. TaxID=2020856 RepID=UPI003C791F1C
MDDLELEQLKYPIGHFVKPAIINPLLVKDWVAQMEALPVNLSDLVIPLSKEQLDTPYRAGGWTVRQVVHHLADSHHHSYIRFKWALTEDRPVIKPYLEKEWALLFDAVSAPIDLSLKHLDAVHAKLVYLLKGLSEEDLMKTFIHPVGNSETTLKENIGRYAWHGNHHLAHIQALLDRNTW